MNQLKRFFQRGDFLTSMSFNTIQSQGTVSAQQKPFTLKEGQVIHGSIKQLFPNQIAEVQVGSNKLVAKLETPLKAGDSHFFQVTNTNGQLELKVVSGPMSQGTSVQGQLNQLMDSMNLPKTQEMRQVLSQYIKNDLPISKEQLLQAEVWVKSMPNQASKEVALQAISRMVDLKMPFTNDVFQALINGSKPTGISLALSTLLQNITQDASLSPNVKNNLVAQLQTIEKPLQAEIGANLLAKATQTLTDPNGSLSNKMQMLNVLKQAGIVSANTTVANWNMAQPNANNNTQPVQAGQLVSQVAASQPSQVSQVVQNVTQWIANETTLTSDQKAQMQQLVNRFAQLPASKQSIEAFTNQLNEQLMKAYSNNQQITLSASNAAGLTAKDQLLSLFNVDVTKTDAILKQLVQVSSQTSSNMVQSMVIEAEQQVQNNMNAQTIEQAMKSVLKGLGLHYESALASAKPEQIESLAQTLKPQLINLVQDPQISPQLKDAAEVVLARINGMQLLSTDNGHQHQLVMQVPLEFLGKKMDATLQWNGRMKDDGKIDADYARVMFYLQMESMDETVIDMQVQNRIITVTVFNENDYLNQLAEPLKEALAKGLSDKEYHLSGVSFKKFESENKAVSKSQTSDEGYDGVDIRI